MKFTVQTAVIGALGLLVCWQAWALSDVKARHAAVEVSLEEASTSRTARTRSSAPDREERRQSRRDAPESTSSERRSASRSQTSANRDESENNATVIESAVEEAIERHDAERKQDQREGWTAVATQRFEAQVEEVGEEYNLSVAVQNQVVDILVDGMQAGMDLRHDVGSGELTYAEAKEEGAALKQDTADTVTELIGEDAAEALWSDMKSGGGWR